MGGIRDPEGWGDPVRQADSMQVWFSGCLDAAGSHFCKSACSMVLGAARF